MRHARVASIAREQAYKCRAAENDEQTASHTKRESDCAGQIVFCGVVVVLLFCV